MKILNLACDDWCNYAYDNMMSLRSVGVDCDMLKRNADPFQRKEQAPIAGFDEMRAAIRKADVVQIFFSHIQLTQTLRAELLRKQVVVYHAGSFYRENTAWCNAIFNPMVERSVIALTEFSGRGAKGEVYIAPSVNTDRIRPDNIMVDSPVMISHFPSNPNSKGTYEIVKMMDWLSKSHKFFFDYRIDQVSADHQLARMRACDIYIELFKPELNGQKYGSWGITAMEAAAMGKVVVTQNLNYEVYKKKYEDCPFILTTTETDFLEKVDGLLRRPIGYIRELGDLTRGWAESNHSYEATGKRIMKDVYGL